MPRTTEELYKDAEVQAENADVIKVAGSDIIGRGWARMEADLRSWKKLIADQAELVAELSAKLREREWQKLEDKLPPPETTVLVLSDIYGYQTDSWHSINTGIPGLMRFATPNVVLWKLIPPTPPQKED